MQKGPLCAALFFSVSPLKFFSMSSLEKKILAVAPLALMVFAYWALAPGLSGGFLFDDYVNLPALGAYGPVDNLRTFALYLTSGHGDPTGRPLAMLSFLLEANDWPAIAAPFLYTNVLLHL